MAHDQPKGDREWQTYSLILKELLGLESSPVAVNCLQEPYLASFDRKVRICKGILDAGSGQTLQLNRANNACFGAAWHLGFSNVEQDPQAMGLIRKFVVEGEKLFSSYEALDNLIAGMGEVPDNRDASFVLAPLETAELEPELVIFVCNPEQACRLLTLSVFIDGLMPQIKIGGPPCRLAVLWPLLTGEVNLSFYDYTARKLCRVPQDQLLVSIPYSRLPRIVESIDRCSAGRAEVEFPAEFRVFLQEKRSKKKSFQKREEKLKNE